MTVTICIFFSSCFTWYSSNSVKSCGSQVHTAWQQQRNNKMQQHTSVMALLVSLEWKGCTKVFCVLVHVGVGGRGSHTGVIRQAGWFPCRVQSQLCVRVPGSNLWNRVEWVHSWQQQKHILVFLHILFPLEATCNPFPLLKVPHAQPLCFTMCVIVGFFSVAAQLAPDWGQLSPVIVTVSPSFRNVLVSPPPRSIVLDPLHDNSSIEPKLSGSFKEQHTQFHCFATALSWAFYFMTETKKLLWRLSPIHWWYQKPSGLLVGRCSRWRCDVTAAASWSSTCACDGETQFVCLSLILGTSITNMRDQRWS